MPKRIALFILGIVLSVGAFLLYQYVTGASFTGKVKKTPGASVNDPAKINADMKYVWESRDENGRIEYLIETDSIDQLKDADGRAFPGQFIFKRPVVNFYQKDGRVLEISGDQCTLVLDQTVRASMGGSAGGRILGGANTPPGAAATNPTEGDTKGNKLLAAVRIGELSGHVRLYLTPRPPLPPDADPATVLPPTAASDALKGGLKIFFDHDLKFDRDMQLLSSAGKIFVRSDAAEFDGEGLELTLTTDSPDGNTLSKDGARRIEYLKIAKGDTIIIHHGAKALNVAEPATRPAPAGAAVVRLPAATIAPPTANPAASTQVAAAQSTPKPKGPSLATAVYKLVFGQNVRAFAGKSDATTALTAEKLNLIFTLSQQMADKPNKKTDTPDVSALAPGAIAPANVAAAGTAAPAPAPLPPPVSPAPAEQPAYVRASDDRPAPISPRVEDDLIVNWVGPMEMRPALAADLQAIGGKLADGSDILLEATGTADKPVTLIDPLRFKVLAGRLLYHRADDRVALQAAAFQRVELQDLTQTPAGTPATVPADNAPRVVLTAPGIDFFQQDQGADRHAVLMGPGTLVIKAPKSDPAHPSPIDGVPTTIAWKETMDVQLVSIDDPKHPGKKTLAVKNAVFRGAGVHSPTLDFSSDTIEAALTHTADPKQPMALQHLLATGNVSATTLTRDGKLLAPGAQGDGLRGDMMEIKTAIPANTLLPVASQLILTGHAQAWQFVNKNALTGAADDANELQKEMVTTRRLVADLKPKPKTKPDEGSPSTPDLKTDDSLGAVSGAVEVVHFTATDDVTVEITPTAHSKQPPIIASAQSLDVAMDNAAKSALALLTAPVPAAPVRLTLGPDNSMQGRRIELLRTRTAENISIAGPGQFRFILPPSKESPQPTPLEVVWQTSMAYDNRDKLAVFTGNPIAQMTGDRPELGRLSADNRLVIQLKAATPASQPAAAAPAAPAVAAATQNALTSLTLDYIKAEGNVQAQGGQLNPDNTFLTQLRLSAEGQLTYHNETHLFEIPGPGSLVIDNHKPDKPDPNNPAAFGTAGQSVFGWKGSFVYNGDAHTINFNKDVDFFFTPSKPFHIATGPAPSTGKAPQQDVKTAHLHTQHLLANLMNSTATSAKNINSPIGLGTRGQELKSVLADGGITTLDAGDFRLKGTTLQFDAPTHTAIATGNGDDPAVIVRPNQLTWFADKITWDMTKDQNDIKMINSRASIQGAGN